MNNIIDSARLGVLSALVFGGLFGVPLHAEQALEDNAPAGMGLLRVHQAVRPAPEIDWPGVPEYLRPPDETGTLTLTLPEPLAILGDEVPPGQFKRLAWYDRQSFPGLEVPAPVFVAHGAGTGPVLCLTAAIHGDELNGIEIVRNLMFGLDPARLNGTVIGVPIVNLHGFRRNSRYLPDRRDLNRFFPGNDSGSSASRIAHSFFQEIVTHCDTLVDLHTGSLRRTNLVQLRADLNNPEIARLTRGFGPTVVLHSSGAQGTLRRAASDAGIPALTLEIGEPMRFQPDDVSHGVKALRSLLNLLGMDTQASRWPTPPSVYYRSSWIRADTGGILTNRVELGQVVEEDDLLGTITDPITNERNEIRAPFAGRILGMALNQAMMPGFAAYHIGVREAGTLPRSLPGSTDALLEIGDDAGLQAEGDRDGKTDVDPEYGEAPDDDPEMLDEDLPDEDLMETER